MPAEGLVMFIDTLAARKTPPRSAIGPHCAFQLRSFGVVSFAKGCKTGINGYTVSQSNSCGLSDGLGEFLRVMLYNVTVY